MLLMWQAPGRLAGDPGAAPRDLAREGIKLVFSPDGEKIAWQAHRTGRPQIWIADRDGANARALTDQRVDAYSPRWSPDGRQIAFYSGDAGNMDVYLVDVASRRVRPLTADKSEDRYPTFAPDGRSIYFSSNRSGRFEIYRMPADGGEAVPVTASGATFAIASYDGHYLYYEYLPGNLGHTGDSPIWRVPMDANGPVVEVLPGWQRAEEQWVVGREGIYYLRARDFRYRDLGTGTDIAILSGAGSYPAVSPDEKTVFFSRQAPAHSELWLVENFR
jgi:Tol biopolymer transport system component